MKPLAKRLQSWEPDVLVLLTIANLTLFALSMYLSSTLAPFAESDDPMAPSSETLYILGMNSPSLVLRGQVHRLITAVFLHGSVLHLLMNTVGLFNLGRHVQGILGPRQFFSLYMITGLVASLASAGRFLVGGDVTFVAGSIGASGAVCGLMGFLYAYVRRGTDPVSVSVRNQLMFWTIAMLAIGFLGFRIDNAAHIGGWVAGFLVRFGSERVRSPMAIVLRARLTTIALAVVTMTALAWSVAGWWVGWGSTSRQMLPLRPVVSAVGQLEYRESGARTRAEEFLKDVARADEAWSQSEEGRALLAYLRTLVEKRRPDDAMLMDARRAVNRVRRALGPYMYY